MDEQKGLVTNTNEQKNFSDSEIIIDEKITQDSEGVDERIFCVSKLPYYEMARIFSKLWSGFKINPYGIKRLLQQLEKITNIPKSEIKIWNKAKRKLLDTSWSPEKISANIHKPSSCDCFACNIVYDENESLENKGCFDFDLEMRDLFT